jgi:cyanophycinase-like exopeptidase
VQVCDVSEHPTIEVLGSTEFEPWAGPVDRLALSRARGGDGRVLVVPTALATESASAFDDEGEHGVEHFESLGFAASVLPLRTREDAFHATVANAVASASMIFFAGGHPEYLSATLTGTPAWEAVVAAHERGAVVGGCSAGAWILGEMVPDSTATDMASHRWEPGLRLVPGVVFAPHWNRLDELLPGLRSAVLAGVPPELALVAVEDRTAIVGDGRRWEVLGEGTVLVRLGEAVQTFHHGHTFSLPAGGR